MGLGLKKDPYRELDAALKAAKAKGLYTVGGSDEEHYKKSYAEHIRNGMTSKKAKGILELMARKSQEDLPETVTLYRGVHGQQAIDALKNGFLDTGAIVSWSETQQAVEGFIED